jgi:hypothetical protein
MVAEGAEGVSMFETTSSAGAVEELAGFIVLNATSGPGMNGVTQAWVAGTSHQHDTSFARLASDGSNSGEISQGVVVSVTERLKGLGEHRGAVELPHAWQGEEDRCVAMLNRLTVRGRLILSELIENFLEPSVTEAELFVVSPQSRDQRQHVLGSGFDTTCGELERGQR